MLNSVLNQVSRFADPRKQITLFSNTASLAEKLGDRALLESSIRSAFARSHEVMAEMKNASPERKLREAAGGYRLAEVTRLGAMSAPQLTLELISSIGDDEAEAYLLMYFAEARLHANETLHAK